MIYSKSCSNGHEINDFIDVQLHTCVYSIHGSMLL
uniref:Uncharacterized protein n=1 Tax=Arundo donax TaxID=35708 RepID=A0A0A9H0I4_ARUDO